jgi:hypothetical protein
MYTASMLMPEADETLSAAGDPLDRLDVDARVAECLPEAGQAARRVRQNHGELSGHGGEPPNLCSAAVGARRRCEEGPADDAD